MSNNTILDNPHILCEHYPAAEMSTSPLEEEGNVIPFDTLLGAALVAAACRIASNLETTANSNNNYTTETEMIPFTEKFADDQESPTTAAVNDGLEAANQGLDDPEPCVFFPATVEGEGKATGGGGEGPGSSLLSRRWRRNGFILASLFRRTSRARKINFDLTENKVSDGVGQLDAKLLTQHHALRSISQGQGQHRRESFLYRSDISEDELSPTTRSRQSSVSLRDCNVSEEMVVTPFAQLISCLRNVRNNYMTLNNIPASRSRRSSSDKELSGTKSPPLLTEEERDVVILETLHELEWCLDHLEGFETHKSAAHLAAHKFKRMLSRELVEYSESNRDHQMSDYISRTFLDQEGKEVIDTTQSSHPIVSIQDVDDEPTPCQSCSCPASKPVPVLSQSASIDLPLSPVTSMSRIPGILTNKKPLFINCATVIPKYGVEVADEKLLDENMHHINTWGMDLFKVADVTNGRPLTTVTYTVLQNWGILKMFKIAEYKLINYLTQVEFTYKPSNPYHNSLHAADVTQSSQVLLRLPSLRNAFGNLEVFATIIAAAVHDVDHPGFTNQFLINNKAELALMYNDESVLENHHLAVAFKLLQTKDCDILETLTAEQFKSFRHMVIGMVLATDMTKHMNHVAHLKTMVEMNRLGGKSSKLTLKNHTDKQQVLQSLVHCADLSNPTKPLPIYCRWTDCIMEEFYQQGDEERRLNVEVSPMCDRLKSNVFTTQTGFIDYVVHPLWETWADLVYPDCQFILDSLEANRQWHIDLENQHNKENERDKDSGTDTQKDNEEDKDKHNVDHNL